jgi:hypothetical protein
MDVHQSSKGNTMSSSASTSIAIPDALHPHAHTETQHGMKFPDGTITWGDSRNSQYGPVNFTGLFNGNKYDVANWASRMRSLANNARIELEKYEAMHSFVKRTIILAVTGTEDVEPKSAAPAAPPWDDNKPESFDQ